MLVSVSDDCTIKVWGPAPPSEFSELTGATLTRGGQHRHNPRNNPRGGSGPGGDDHRNLFFGGAGGGRSSDDNDDSDNDDDDEGMSIEGESSQQSGDRGSGHVTSRSVNLFSASTEDSISSPSRGVEDVLNLDPVSMSVSGILRSAGIDISQHHGASSLGLAAVSAGSNPGAELGAFNVQQQNISSSSQLPDDRQMSPSLSSSAYSSFGWL